MPPKCAKVRYSFYSLSFLPAILFWLELREKNPGAQFLSLASEMRTHAKASQTLRNRNARILPAWRERLVYSCYLWKHLPRRSLRLVSAIFHLWEYQNAHYCASSIGTIPSHDGVTCCLLEFRLSNIAAIAYLTAPSSSYCIYLFFPLLFYWLRKLRATKGNGS